MVADSTKPIRLYLGEIEYFIFESYDPRFNESIVKERIIGPLAVAYKELESVYPNITVDLEVGSIAPGCIKTTIIIYLNIFVLASQGVLNCFEIIEKYSNQIPSKPPVGEKYMADKPISVKKGDTLWGLTLDYKHPNYSHEQLMLATFKRNGHAFARNNINHLLAGTIIMIPAQKIIVKISREDAKAEFDRLISEH